MLFLHVDEWSGDHWKITREQANHIKARRLYDGDEVCLIDGKGKWQKGFLTQQKTLLDLKEAGHSPKPEIRTCLAFGWSRPQTMDWIIEKAVELGVTDIMPLLTEYVGTQPTVDQIQKRTERFQSLASSALCQCEGHYLPTLHAPKSLNQWLQEPTEFTWILLDPTGDTPQKLPEGHIGVLVGPEGGWSERERSSMLLKAQFVWSLSDRILRVETASIAGMALMNLKGDLL